MKEGVLKGVTLSLATQMATEFRQFCKALIAYAASKGYKSWPGVIENMKALKDKVWKTERPNKSLYGTKCITKIKIECEADILKQEWIVTDCEMETELEDNYTNKQRQRLAVKALYCKQGDALYNLIQGQLHSDIIVATKNSTIPLYETVNIERDVVGLLSILLSVCVKNLTGTKVDPFYDARLFPPL